MLFSKLILLFSIFEIDRLAAVRTESLLIGNSEEIKMENMLIEFMTDLKNFGFDNLHPRRLIVLGKKENFLQTAKILLESGTPCFISNKTGAIVLPVHFGADSVVLFFIDGLTDFEISLAFAKLPRDYRCKVVVISVEDKSVDKSTAMNSAFKMMLKNVSFARFDGRVINIYKQVLSPNCTGEVRLTSTWVPKEGFRGSKHILENNVVRSRIVCPIFVSTFSLLPTMRLQENEDKSLRIKGGLEGHLVKNIATHLNMIPVVKLPSVEEELYVTSDGTVSGIIGDVARGVATIGIGQIRPTLRRAQIVDLTTPYNHECIVWTVPLITKYNYSVVIFEFSLMTWTALILSVILSSGLFYAIQRVKTGHGSFLSIFDVIAMTLNYAIPSRPSGVLCKVLLLSYLHYSRIISTAYSASLSSILTTTKLEPTIVDDAGIIAAGLRTAGTESSRDMLANMIPQNSTRVELINRYEVITTATLALLRIVNRRDIAYLRHRSTINHFANKMSMAGKPVEFYPIPSCVLSYNSVIVTPKGSHLTHRVNQIIYRLREAGIYNHWLNLDRGSDRNFKIVGSSRGSLSQLGSVFILYLCCLIPAFLAFAAELIAFKLQINWFAR